MAAGLLHLDADALISGDGTTRPVVRDGRIVAIEVKFKHTAETSDGKHLRWLNEKLGPKVLDTVLMTTGPDTCCHSDGIAAVPAALLGP